MTATLALPVPPIAPGPSRLSRLFTRLSAVVALALLALNACWLLAGSFWSLDLVANLGAQSLLLTLLCLTLWLFMRRWKLSAVALVAAALQLVSLGAGRVAFWPRSAAVSTPAGGGSIRILHYNASTRGEGPPIDALMGASGADVVSLLCPPVHYQRDVIYGHGLEDRYAGKLVRPFRSEPGGGPDITAGVLLSRWPITPVDTAWLGGVSAYLIAGIVQRPAGAPGEGGPFATIAVHPRSPRSPQRWAIGNLVAAAVGDLAARLESQGYPVIVVADLNATPTGYRSHLLHHAAGLRRAKPLLDLRGTYPLPLGPDDDSGQGPVRGAPWPFSIAIDDVLVSPGIAVARWTVLDRLDSEHRPILVELVIPAPAGGVSSDASR